MFEHWYYTPISEFSVLLLEQVTSPEELQHPAFWLALGQVAMLDGRALCLSVPVSHLAFPTPHRSRDLLSSKPSAPSLSGLAPPDSWIVESWDPRPSNPTVPQLLPLSPWEKKNTFKIPFLLDHRKKQRILTYHCPIHKSLVRAILSYWTCT